MKSPSITETRLELLHSLQEQLRAERDLRRVESRYLALFRFNPIPTYIWQLTDKGFVLVDYNEAAFDSTNSEVSRVMGSTVRATFELDYPEVFGALVDCIKHRKSSSMTVECSFLGKDRSCERWFLARFIFVPPDSVMVMTEDITDELEAARERERLDLLKDEFIANVSHELRTPLALILGYTSLLTDGVFGKPLEDMVKPLALVHSKAEFITRLLNTYLLIFRLDHIEDTIKGNFATFDIGELVQEVAQDFTVLANQAGLKLKIGKVASTLIKGNKDWIRLVCNNLLSNAIKFTDSGWVRISTWQGASWCIIEVSDSGIGIPQEEQEKIFQRFYQVSGGDTRERGGSGLGLAVVKSVVEIHGGQVEIKSEVGQGSIFRLILPL